MLSLSRNWIRLAAVRIWKFPFRRQRLINETGKMKTNPNVGVEWFDQWGGVLPPKM